MHQIILQFDVWHFTYLPILSVSSQPLILIHMLCVIQIRVHKMAFTLYNHSDEKRYFLEGLCSRRRFDVNPF